MQIAKMPENRRNLRKSRFQIKSNTILVEVRGQRSCVHTASQWRTVPSAIVSIFNYNNENLSGNSSNTIGINSIEVRWKFTPKKYCGRKPTKIIIFQINKNNNRRWKVTKIHSRIKCGKGEILNFVTLVDRNLEI